MGLETATAIVLRTIDYQESSKIITVLTESHGKFALIARGAKKPKGLFSGVVETGNTLHIGFAYKPNRMVQDLRSADLVHSVASLRSDFTSWLLLFQVLERITALVHEHEKNTDLFQLLTQFLSWLTKQEQVPVHVLPYIQIRCMSCCGIDVQFELSDIAKQSYLHIPSGILSEVSTQTGEKKFNQRQTKFLTTVLSGRSKDFLLIDLSKNELVQLVQHLDAYFHYHIEGYNPQRSQQFFDLVVS
jgi:DNA repair protein RecO (recombination protein O)